MYIKTIHIQRYKSLYDVRLNPGHFTVLVGPNNAGKSNLSEALDFLSEVYDQGLELAVNRKGGFENIAFRRMRRTKSPLRFSLEACIKLQEVPVIRTELRRLSSLKQREDVTSTEDVKLSDEFLLSHEFDVSAGSQSVRADFQIQEEYVSIRRSKGPEEPYAEISREGDLIEIEARDDLASVRPWRTILRPFSRADALFDEEEFPVESTELVLQRLTLNPLLRQFSRNLAQTALYQSSPVECRKPGVPTPNPMLERHGGNLPAVVDFIRDSHPDAWQEILSAMREILPGLEDVGTAFSSDRRLTLAFSEHGVGRPWTSGEVSDGTIQSLALFVALHDPRSPLVVIEEPENSVHPWIVRSFVDACRRSSAKQVIVTSHSPALIGHLEPSEIAVVSRKDGRTHVKRLQDIDPDAERLWSEGEVSPFDLLDSGYVREAVPEGFA